MVRAGHYTPDRRTLCDGAPSKVSNELQPRLVLKHGSHLLLLNEAGNMPACNTAGLGLYHDDTRYLSQWELLVNGTPLTLVSCSVDHGYAGKFVYTNAEASGLSDGSFSSRAMSCLATGCTSGSPFGTSTAGRSSSIWRSSSRPTTLTCSSSGDSPGPAVVSACCRFILQAAAGCPLPTGASTAG